MGDQAPEGTGRSPDGPVEAPLEAEVAVETPDAVDDVTDSASAPAVEDTAEPRDTDAS